MEFRTGCTQLTDDENTAFIMLAYIMARLFYESDEINFYIPMTKLHENFERSFKKNSLLTEKFFFRTNVFD